MPSSAVQHLGALTYVTLVKGTVQTRQIISVGAVGTLFTQVTAGLTMGQTVMLADLNAAIPTSSVNSRFARFAGAGGLGGLGGAAGLEGTGTGGGTTRTGGGTGAGR